MSFAPSVRTSSTLPARGGRPRLGLGLQTMLFFGALMLAFSVVVVSTAEALLKQRLAQNCRTDFEYFARAISSGLENTLDGFRRELSLTASAPVRYAGGSIADARRTAVNEAIGVNPDFVWVAFINRDGTVAVATDGAMEGESVRPRPWFSDLRDGPFSARLEDWPALAEEIRKAARSDEPGRRVFLGIPLTDATGRFDGALVAQLGWNWARRVQRSVIPDRARDAQLGATIYAGTTEVLVDSGGTGWSSPPDAPDVPADRGAHGAKVENTADGSEYLTGYARPAKYPNLNWLVTVRQSTRHAFAPTVQLRRATVSWALLIIAAGLVVAGYFAYRIARRMRSVKLAAQSIMSGDMLTAMPFARDNTEVEEMCDAVSQLIEQLQKPAREAEAKRNPLPPKT
jgi:HAMP domain-containing protein